MGKQKNLHRGHRSKMKMRHLWGKGVCQWTSRPTLQKQTCLSRKLDGEILILQLILCSSNVHSRILVFYIYIKTIQHNYLIFLKKIGKVSPPKASGWEELEAQPVLMWVEGAEAFFGSASRQTSPGSPIVSRRVTAGSSEPLPAPGG